MRYEVTTVDVCVQGFERLRSQSEFMTVAYLSKTDDPEAVVQSLKDDLQSYAQPDGFDYDAARAALDAWFDEAGIAYLRSTLNGLDDPEEGEDEDDSNPVMLFVYVNDTEAD